MKKYQVVRTYEKGKEYEDLQKAFMDGYEFVSASEYVPESVRGGLVRYGYIEYILAKETTTEAEEKLTALYTWLNDMRLGIAPDENTPEDEREERQEQVDIIDQIMEWMEENGV